MTYLTLERAKCIISFPLPTSQTHTHSEENAEDNGLQDYPLEL